MAKAVRVVKRRILWVELIFVMQLTALGGVLAAERTQSPADAYVKQAAEMLGQNKFSEAADKYQLAAKEAAF